MRPLHRIDAVDLNEAEALDQIMQRGAARGTGRLLRQGVAVEEQPPCVAIVKSGESGLPHATGFTIARKAEPAPANTLLTLIERSRNLPYAAPAAR